MTRLRKQRYLHMLKKLFLSVQRSHALKRFPRSARSRSYVYFDSSGGYGGVQVRLMLYESDAGTLLSFRQKNPLDDIVNEGMRDILPGQMSEVICWLKDRLEKSVSMFGGNGLCSTLP